MGWTASIKLWHRIDQEAILAIQLGVGVVDDHIPIYVLDIYARFVHILVGSTAGDRHTPTGLVNVYTIVAILVGGTVGDRHIPVYPKRRDAIAVIGAVIEVGFGVGDLYISGYIVDHDAFCSIPVGKAIGDLHIPTYLPDVEAFFTVAVGGAVADGHIPTRCDGETVVAIPIGGRGVNVDVPNGINIEAMPPSILVGGGVGDRHVSAHPRPSDLAATAVIVAGGTVIYEYIATDIINVNALATVPIGSAGTHGHIPIGFFNVNALLGIVISAGVGDLHVSTRPDLEAVAVVCGDTIVRAGVGNRHVPIRIDVEAIIAITVGVRVVNGNAPGSRFHIHAVIKRVVCGHIGDHHIAVDIHTDPIVVR